MGEAVSVRDSGWAAETRPDAGETVSQLPPETVRTVAV